MGAEGKCDEGVPIVFWEFAAKIPRTFHSCSPQIPAILLIAGVLPRAAGPDSLSHLRYLSSLSATTGREELKASARAEQLRREESKKRKQQE